MTFLLLEFVDNVEGSMLWRALKNRVFRPKGNSRSPLVSQSAGRTH